MKYFKTISVLIFLLCAQAGFSQKKGLKRPEYVIIVNDKLTNMEGLNNYSDQIKAMNKGVSQEARDSLALKYGEKVGGKEFIVLVDLLADKEKTEHLQEPKSNNNISNSIADDELKCRYRPR